MLKKVAFTLAEVLITLGIIGVVAAMTIPNLMANYQHKRFKSQFNKMYSQLGQLSYKLQSEGIACQTTHTNVYHEYQLFKDFILENIKVIDAKDTYSESPYQTFKTYNLKESKLTIYPNCFDGRVRDRNNDTLYTTADGANFAICMHNNQGHLISIDINGYNGKPNAFGHDLFFFRFNRNTCELETFTNQWRMYDDEDTEEDKAGESWGMWTAGVCSKNSNNGENGFACGKWAIQDKNPDGLPKGYWESLPR